MKKLFFIIAIISAACKYAKATEIRQLIVEACQPELRYDTFFFTPNNFYIEAFYCGDACFKMYDTLVGYTNCPCLPDDTVRDIHWETIGDEEVDVTVKKGTVLYKCWESITTHILFNLSAAVNGISLLRVPAPEIWISQCKVEAKFELKELESGCNYKKLQVIDSTEHTWASTDSLSKWYLTVRDSLDNMVHADSGYERVPFIDSAYTLIHRQRDSPIVELHNAGLYSITLIVEKNPGFDRFLNDTSTIYNIRVPDCTTGINSNTTKNSNIQVQVLENKQLQLNTTSDKKLELHIYSIDGKKVFANTVRNTNTIFDLSMYNKGMYIVSVTDENGLLVFSNKIVLN